MVKLLYLLYLIKIGFCGCKADHRRDNYERSRSSYKVTKIGKLDDLANESSGLARVANKNTYWTHNDSGGSNELYEINSSGEVIGTRVIPNSKNIDWEDLAQAPDGTLFIGDIGNNGNRRRDLTIYRYHPDSAQVHQIRFGYADQREFPPPTDQLNFDCEAFFYLNDALYLFSKNRSESNKHVKLYKLPALAGDFIATPQDSIVIPEQVTSADVSPDGKTFALLTYGKIFLFSITGGEVNFSQPKACIPFAKKQTEAILFLTNTDLMVTNEQKQIFRITAR
jgi:hypothetical protein